MWVRSYEGVPPLRSDRAIERELLHHPGVRRVESLSAEFPWLKDKPDARLKPVVDPKASLRTAQVHDFLATLSKSGADA
jgi:hypothetical protein